MFKANRFSDHIKVTRIQCSYDQGRDSDSIMLLKVFEDWMQKWHPHLKNESNMMLNQSRAARNRNFFISRDERNWCFEKCLDVNILRETALMVEEIKSRFYRLNIPQESLNS